MIDGLVGGRVYGKPTQRTGASGKPFVTAKVRAATGDGDSLFVNVIAFSDSVRVALLALDDGDSVCLSGVLTPKCWQPPAGGEARPALDMVAHAITTPYHVTRKRQAMAEAPE
jgi:hypothetical protein